jgi:hypothetical protein
VTDGKKCNKCEEYKPITEFYFRKDNKKYRPDCKKCKNNLDAAQKKKRREYNKSYWQKNREKEIQRYKEWYDSRYHDKDQVKRRRKNNYKKYGISEKEYMDLYEKNNYCCYICGKEELVKRNGKIKRLAIDHCHKTGKVRGLLCQNCNRGIGLLGDDIERLKSAIKYLEETK